MHILHDDVSDLIDDEVDEQTMHHDDSDEIEQQKLCIVAIMIDVSDDEPL